MTDPFEIDFEFDKAEGQLSSTPTALVGVRYTVGGKDIVPEAGTEDPYTRDYVPDLLHKWLHYVVSLNDGEDRTFEFTEYSDIQFRLRPSSNNIELTVNRRHSDESFGTYNLDLEQMAVEIVDATTKYQKWLGDQNSDLLATETVQDLQALSDRAVEEVGSFDNGCR